MDTLDQILTLAKAIATKAGLDVLAVLNPKTPDPTPVVVRQPTSYDAAEVIDRAERGVTYDGYVVDNASRKAEMDEVYNGTKALPREWMHVDYQLLRTMYLQGNVVIWYPLGFQPPAQFIPPGPRPGATPWDVQRWLNMLKIGDGTGSASGDATNATATGSASGDAA